MSGRDRLTEAHERLAKAVADLASGEDWRAMLAVAARFHSYSANNVLLIVAQRPESTRVAGYRTWQRLGRQVRAGEKGIATLAPCTYRADVGEDDQSADTGTRLLLGFRVVHVFDVSQTDGDDLPEVGAVTLDGDEPAGLWGALAVQVAEAGFSLDRGDCRPANGRTSFGSRTVSVRADLSGAQAVKTLAHELAHVRLHDGTEYASGCRGRAEVEAESVAYLVCAAVGLASDDYTFPYVAGWSGGDPAAIKTTAERTIACARSIVEALGLHEAEAAA